jgi:hypothetical protein
MFLSLRGKRILQVDYSGLTELSELESVAREASAVMALEPPGSVRALIDLTAVPYGLRWVRRLGEMAIANAPRVRARALIGVPAMSHPVLEELSALAGTPMQAFPDREVALDWLVGLDE